jgi:SAM-dependent methyltransferase
MQMITYTMSNNTIDPQKFKSLQRQGWDNAAEGWKKWWKTIEEGAQVVSDKLIELAQIKQGHKVLDIATGIGEPAVTAARKVQPHGKVIAIDISPQMLAIAKERAKDNGFENIIEFREADAESFALPASAFDAIISRFGLMFLPDLPNALKTMREALVPNGIIAAAVWSSPPKVPSLSLAFGTVMNEIGASPPPPGTPGPFSLADVGILRDKFMQAGFQDINIESHTMNFKLSSPEEFTAFNRAIAAPLNAMMAGQSAARQEEIWNAVTEAARKHADPHTGALNLVNEVIYVAAKK